MLTQNRCEQNDLGMQGMCEHKQIDIWPTPGDKER